MEGDYSSGLPPSRASIAVARQGSMCPRRANSRACLSAQSSPCLFSRQLAPWLSSSSTASAHHVCVGLPGNCNANAWYTHTRLGGGGEGVVKHTQLARVHERNSISACGQPGVPMVRHRVEPRRTRPPRKVVSREHDVRRACVVGYHIVGRGGAVRHTLRAACERRRTRARGGHRCLSVCVFASQIV